jgi:16S rRNA (cytosine967-C5)-methyltransferase
VTGQKPREITLRVLRQRERGEFVENLLEAALAGSQLSTSDRHLCQELVYGIVRQQAALDWLIARRTAGHAQKPGLRELLRLGLYQIFWLDRIPAHAAVHETVELAKYCGFGAQAGFVNAVLRGALREFDAITASLRELKTTQPPIGYSHPEWLAQRWQQRWGVERAARLMEWNNTPPKTFARVNTLKADPAILLPQWRDENVEYDFLRCDWVPENTIFELKSHPPLSRLPSFQQGLFYIQDPSTLLAVHECNPQPGEAVLDLCAAPGGKLTFLAQILRNEGRLIAHDVSPARLKLVDENCARLGVTCVETILPTALNPRSSPPFDRILADVPCSNTGAMRRRIDLRWRIRLEELGRLRATQLDLLRQAASLLKPGGTLVYSTCSLEPEENREVVNEFLAQHRDLRLERDRELLPFVEGVDGAYVGQMSKCR